MGIFLVMLLMSVFFSFDAAMITGLSASLLSFNVRFWPPGKYIALFCTFPVYVSGESRGYETTALVIVWVVSFVVADKNLYFFKQVTEMYFAGKFTWFLLVRNVLLVVIWDTLSVLAFKEFTRKVTTRRCPCRQDRTESQ